MATGHNNYPGATGFGKISTNVTSDFRIGTPKTVQQI